MKNLIATIVTLFYILITDTILSVLLSIFYGIFLEFNKSAYNVRSMIEGALFFSLLRLIYCFAISGILIYALNRFSIIKHKIVQLAASDLSVYLLVTSLIAFATNKPRDFFLNPLFYIIAVATFISPIVLRYIPLLNSSIAILPSKNDNRPTSSPAA